MLWSGWPLPVKIPEGDYQVAVPLTDARVQMLPPKKRSLRVVAESFRLIVKHLQTLSRSKFIPAYKKQGTCSLQKLGFSNYHEGGISRRPILPNAKETYSFISEMILTLAQERPFHTDFSLPDLPDKIDKEPWPEWPEVAPSKRDQFTQHMRYVMFRKKDLDSVMHPGPN